jgi:hypothetical protein
MTNHPNAITGCLLVGEYVDEAELPSNLDSPQGEAVRPQIVADYLDFWGSDESLKDK